MSKIPNRSFNVEQDQHAHANNQTTVLKGAHTARSIFESCRDTKVKPHAYSNKLASTKRCGKKIGYLGALILRYLGYLIRKYGETFKGKKWARVNLDHLASLYPYASRAGLDRAIQRLIKLGVREAGNWNIADGRASYDRTRWYHVPREWMHMAEEELRYFYPELAVVIGVPAAVIHYNVMHWVAETGATCFSLQPATQTKLQCFSKATSKRAIAILCSEQLIYPVLGKQCLYTAEAMETGGSKVDESGSKVDKGGSKVDEGGSKVDNNSIERPIESELKESSKTEPAAPFANSSFVSDEHKQEDDKDPFAEHGNDEHDSDEQQLPVDDLPWPVISDIDELRLTNRINNALVEQCNTDDKNQLYSTASTIVFRFFEECDTEWLVELYEDATDEELFHQLLPRFRAYFAKAGIPHDNGLLDIFYYGAFECILGALWRSRHGDRNLHPIALFIPVAYEFHLKFWKRAEERRLQAVAEEFEQRRKDFASPDEALEDCADLTPAEKTRVFKQGLYSRNKIGAIHFDQQLRTDEIAITANALNKIQALFAANPGITPADLLKVMDGCLELHRDRPTPTRFRRGVLWHARKGHKLGFFVRYLPVIVKQLEMTGSCRIQAFPGSSMEAEEVDMESDLEAA